MIESAHAANSGAGIKKSAVLGKDPHLIGVEAEMAAVAAETGMKARHKRKPFLDKSKVLRQLIQGA